MESESRAGLCIRKMSERGLNFCAERVIVGHLDEVAY